MHANTAPRTACSRPRMASPWSMIWGVSRTIVMAAVWSRMSRCSRAVEGFMRLLVSILGSETLSVAAAWRNCSGGMKMALVSVGAKTV